MTLQITGQAVVLKSYTRVPMRDSFGDVTAYINPRYVDYRPIGGFRVARAKIMAAEIGGEAIRIEKQNGPHYIVRKYFTDAKKKKGTSTDKLYHAII